MIGKKLIALMAVFWPLASLAAPFDAQVIKAVLTHFANRNDTMLGKDGIILVNPETDHWTMEHFRSYSLVRRGGKKCGIAPSFFEALADRNSRVQSSAPLLVKSNRWRLSNPSEGKSIYDYDRSANGEPIKTTVRLSMPAYSTNGDTAFVLFMFRWSIHGAAALYVTERSDDGWGVKCSDLVFYL
jgi:hypothetical protein